MTTTMRSGLGRVWELEEKLATQAIDLGMLRLDLADAQVITAMIDTWIETYRELLPGDKTDHTREAILKAFGEKAVTDIGTLMAACIDYRNTLIRANIGDPVSGRHGGVEDIMRRYGVKIETQRRAGVEYLNAYISGVTS